MQIGRNVLVMAVLLAMLGDAIGARACNVPVFRYALEKWEADPYQVVIFNRGQPDAKTQSLIQELNRQIQAASANVEVQVVDPTTEMEPALKELLGKHAELPLPWAAVLYPVSRTKPDAKPEVAWAGVLDKTMMDGLIDSPKRREISRHVLQGDSVVWVLLESGDKTKDAAASRIIEAGVASFMNERGNGEQPPPEIALSPNVPLKLSFSTVTLSREDATEKWFVALLLHMYPQLAESKEPIVFPVFGRGRVLGAAAGAEVKAASIAVGCEFLTGDCACVIKDQNPGRDLLMAMDWEGKLGERVVTDKPLPPLTGILPDAATKPAQVAEAPAVGQAADTNGVMRNVWLGLGAAVVAVGVATVMILRRAKRGVT